MYTNAIKLNSVIYLELKMIETSFKTGRFSRISTITWGGSVDEGGDAN